MNEFDKGETVIFDIQISNYVSGILVDPTSILISIITASQVTKVNEVAMSKTSTGVYTYSWTSDEAGMYRVLYKAVDGTKITYKKSTFRVVNF